LGNVLVEDDGLQKAQAAVVLGGDSHGVRIIKAAELAQAGYVPYVIVDGPQTLVGYESDMSILYAEKRGYSAALFRPLQMPPSVHSTVSEAGFVGRYLKQKGIHKILLVTSNFHTHRAAYLFRKVNPWLQVIAVPALDPEFNPNSWWTYRDGQRTFVLEWLKTVDAYIGL
jgi:uncharacterized SAM-binding protein YcdF (DUF218 family)